MIIYDLIHKLMEMKRRGEGTRSMVFITPDGKRWALDRVDIDPRSNMSHFMLRVRGKYEDQPPHEAAGWNPNTD